MSKVDWFGGESISYAMFRLQFIYREKYSEYFFSLFLFPFFSNSDVGFDAIILFIAHIQILNFHRSGTPPGDVSCQKEQHWARSRAVWSTN